MAEREGGGDEAEPCRGAAEQQQADEEQDVIGSDEDVLDTRRHECAEHRAHALPRAGEVVEHGMPRVEDGLVPQGLVLVDVHEGLVAGVVREEHRVHVDLSGRADGVDRDVESQPLAVGHRRDAVEPHGDRDAVEQDGQATLQHRRQGGSVLPGDGRVEQRVGVAEPQLVGGVEVVDGQGAADAAAGEGEVEITEGSGVRQGGRRRQRQPEPGRHHRQDHTAHGRQCTWSGGSFGRAAPV